MGIVSGKKLYFISKKTFFIVLAAVFLHVPMLAAETNVIASSSTESVLPLTPNEQKWLDQHKTIRIAYDGSLPPYSFVNDNGKIDGIALEIMGVLSRRLGIEFSIYPSAEWTSIYKAAAKRKVDMIATMVKRPDRAEWFAFTKPYITKSLVIVTQLGNSVVHTRDDLRDKKIAVVKGYQYAEQVGNEFPSARRIYVDTMLESLQHVVSGQAEAAILFLGTANYLQSKYKLENLKVAAFYDRNSANESIAVRKDWPVLLGILQKGLDSLTEEEVQQIFAKWISGDPKVVSPLKDTQKPEPGGEVSKSESVKPEAVVNNTDAAQFEQKQETVEVPDASVDASPTDEHTGLKQLSQVGLFVALLFVVWLIVSGRRKEKIKKKTGDGRMVPLEELPAKHKETEHSAIEYADHFDDEKLAFSLRDSTRPQLSEYIYYQHDCEGRFSYVSDSVSRLLGYSEDDFRANYRDYLTDNPLNADIDVYTENCIKGSPNSPYEIELFDSAGVKRRFEVMDTPVYDGQGHCVGVDGVMHELSEPAVAASNAQTKRITPDKENKQQAPVEDSALLTHVRQAILAANRTHKSFALIYLSLDRLRLLNGSALNFAPDEVLDEAGKRLYATLRNTDTVVKLDNNRFALLLPDTETGAINLIIDKIRKILQIPYLIGVTSIVLDASIGSAVYPGSHNDADALIKQAKVFLYGNDGDKSNTSAPIPDDLLHDETIQLQQDLVVALDECKITLRAKNNVNINALSRLSQFVVYYQSRHHADNYDIAGFEALIRWHHPRLGLLLPKDFISLVKEVGMLDILTYWIIQQVSFQALAWDKSGSRPDIMSVNLEDLTVKQAVDVNRIVEIIKETGAKPEWLEFSIPESEIARHTDSLIPIVNQFVDAGLAVAIHNFGSESTLLTRLKSIPARMIEIDPEYIRGLPANLEDADIISYTIGMLHELGKIVIAKEVESEEQLECLKRYGCDIIQGHLLSKPLPAKEAKELIETLPNFVWFLRQS